MLYNPPHFHITDQDRILSLISDMSFATLVSNGPQGPVVSHLPLFLDRAVGPKGTLIGHVARANPHWTIADLTAPSIVIVAGPDAYVSPNWYPSKADTGKAVPTWNYQVIHAVGMLRFHDDTAFKLDAVTRLTNRHEGKRPDGWRVEDAPDAYIAAQLRGIVGLSLEILSLEGKDKLSQNRAEPDRQGVIDGLAGEPGPGSAGVLGLMRGSDPA